MPSRVRQHARYTLEDYLSWPEDVRRELIDGGVYDMTPSPTILHQELVGKLAYAFQSSLDSWNEGSGGGGSDCRVLLAPIDVVLTPNTVVQPDVVLVCDPLKLSGGRYVDGAPDLVVEVLSPSTALKDRREKRGIYEAAGVREYLIVDPDEHYVEYYRLDENGRYGASMLLGAADALGLMALPEMALTLSALFGWEAPRVAEPVLPYAR